MNLRCRLGFHGKERRWFGAIHYGADGPWVPVMVTCLRCKKSWRDKVLRIARPGPEPEAPPWEDIPPPPPPAKKEVAK